MSRSTNWMKKGFAWLLCLIMLTGMLSSAAVAGDKDAKEVDPVVFTYKTFPEEAAVVDYGDNVWASSLSFYATFSVTNRPSGVKVFYEWFYEGESGDIKVLETSESIHFSNNKNKDGYYVALSRDDYEQNFGVLYNKNGAGNYYCKVSVKRNKNAGAIVSANTEKVYIGKNVKLVFVNGAEGNQYDLEKYVKVGELYPDDDMPNAPVVSGFKCVGWKEVGTGERMDFTKPVVKAGKYKAVYEEVSKFTATFYYNHQDYSPSSFPGTVKKDCTVERPEDLGKCNDGTHTFVDWYTDDSLTETFSFEKPIESNVNIYAGWGYVVKFDYGDYSVENPLKDYYILDGKTISVPGLATDSTNTWTIDYWTVKNEVFDEATVASKDLANQGVITFVAHWTKAKQGIGLPYRTEVTYDGKKHSVDIVDANGNIVTDSIPSSAYYIVYTNVSEGGGETSETKNFGLYTATLNLTDEGENNYYIINDAGGGALTIKKKLLTIVWDNTNLTYNGKEQGPDFHLDLVGKDVDGVDFSLNGKATDAGENYIATVVLVGDAKGNYELPNNASQKYSIAPIELSVEWGKEKLEYNGIPQAPKENVTGFLSSDNKKVGYRVDGKKTDAGENYTAEIVLTGAKAKNYKLPEGSASTTFSIARKTLTVKWEDTVLVYNEKPQAPKASVEGILLSDKKVKWDYDGKETEIGENYEATIVLSGDKSQNYQLPEDQKSTPFKIVRIKPTLSIWKTQESVQYGNSFVFYYSLYNASAGVTVEFEKDIASASIKGNTITITGTGVGTTTVTVKVPRTKHHEEVTQSFELTVNKRVIELDWKGKEYTYDGGEHCPTADLKPGSLVFQDKKEDLGLKVIGEQTDAGKDYEATASISSDKYELAEESATWKFTIKKAEVTISSAERIGLTYGDKYDVTYSITGAEEGAVVNVEIKNPRNKKVIEFDEKGQLVTVNAGDAEIVLSYSGDKNHKEKEKRIPVHVSAKEVTIKWDKTSIKWDGEGHAPTATIVGLVNGDNIKAVVYVDYVFGYPSEVGKYTARAALPWNAKNYTIKNGYITCGFEIYRVADDKLTFEGNIVKDYLITATNPNPKLDLNGLKYVISYNDGLTVKHSVKSSMVSGFSLAEADLGEQTITVKVTVDGKELTGSFTVTVKKELTINWNAEDLVYNRDVQGPKASVIGMNADDFSKYISIAFEGKDANTEENPYKATATLTEEGEKRYALAKDCNISEYTIAPKPVTLTWSFDGAAFEPIDGIGSYDYFVGSDKIAPTVEVGGVIEDDDCQLALITSDSLTSDPLADTTSVGVYYVRASLFNSNYVFDASTTTSVSYRIINKLDNANIKVEIPQCGQESPYSVNEIRAGIEYVLDGMSRIPVADLDMVAMNQTAAVAATSDEKPVVEKALVLINWASLGQADANSKLGVRGILVPQVKGTFEDNESFFNAIGSLEDGVVSVKGGTTYSVILILTADSMTGFDADAINLIVSDEKENQKALRYVVATKYGVVALVDIDAVHNYDDQNPTIVDPEEGKAGSRTVKCYLVQDNVNQYNHDFVTSIPALKVTEIKVVKGEGFTDSYSVGDAFDYTGLKILVSLSNGEEAFNKSYERDVTEDMISGFDSTEAGEKTITVAYGDCKAEFKVTVSKKQSSIDLKNTGEKVTATYGDAPIDLVFDAVNGEVIISSTDEKVAKVENGKLVIVGAGETTITLEIKDTDAVVGIKKSFTFEVERKVVGLEWSKDNTFTEDGAKHSLTAKATGLVGTDSCDVIVEGGSAEVGTHTVTATGLSNKNYKLPENASTTFVINAKEEPKKEEPKKEEPKKEEPKAEEPKKEDPKAEDPKKEETKIKADVKISNQFKDTYVVGEKFDPTGLTLEIENADGTKTVIPVTNEMVSGFDSSKVGNGEAIITYEDFSKKIPVTIVEKGEYTFTITTEANGDMHFVVVRKPGNEIAYSLYLGTYIDGKLVPADGIKTWSGSVHGLLFADYLKTLPAGDHKIEVVFKDGKAVATLTIPATTPASDASPVTGDTGNQMMWIILLAAAAVVLVVIRVYAAKRSNAE